MSERLAEPPDARRRTQQPMVLVLRAVKRWIGGRIHRGELPHEPLRDGNEVFVPFRKISLEPKQAPASASGAIFRVRFRFKNLSPGVNRLLSLLPVPLIVAQPGFRSKTWLLGRESGDFMGYYEFDTLADAEAYWDSLPLRMMRRRAAPGSLSHEAFARPDD